MKAIYENQIKDKKLFHLQEFLEELAFLNNFNDVNGLIERITELMEGIFIKDIDNDKISIYIYNNVLKKYVCKNIGNHPEYFYMLENMLESVKNMPSNIIELKECGAFNEFYENGYELLLLGNGSKKFYAKYVALIFISSENFRNSERDIYMELSGLLMDMIAVCIENVIIYQDSLSYKKFASLGKIVSKIAHEINNPLFSIINYSQLLKINFAGKRESKDLFRFAETIQRESERCKKIVEEILKLSKFDDCKKRKINLNVTINSALEVLDNRINKSNVKVETKFDGKCRFIESDSDKLEQIIINLLSNSLDSFEKKKGTIVITTRSLDDFVEV